ncbi:hypothetical protein QLL95_gp0020 [Cotonvirus japonicus]|uniref:Uncharacterized protein n=1 Tax=Cotonvirus japonicus TaxID=2811091 RepID=A0ABM7NQR5_9VIRU|nr:hypothetical protein QLL95_gp0020 [Cotonvirus japonicus]BCS82509.1 hypothetical protein [Cotonvirus japonicus]
MRKSNDCPKIINQVVDFLKGKNHQCTEILFDSQSKKQHKLTWCMKDVCITNSNNVDKNNDQRKTPLIMKELCKFLKENDHACCMIIGMQNHKFKWCMKDVCERKLMYDDMARRQAEEDKFVEKLRNEGHTCIRIMESYPSQTGWCRQKICVNIKADENYKK